ncbi:MAG: FtsX-like permease family protein, partial [Bacteroidota bacterium]
QSMDEITIGSFVGAPLSLRLPQEAYIVLFVLAMIIMFSACLNYTNLSLARVLTRVREIGVRKVNGASKWHLVFQFLTESILISLFALVMANVLLLILKPALNGLWINQVLSFNLSINATILAVFMLFAVSVGILAGLYPSLVLSGFTPLRALKNFSGDKAGKNRLRKTLSITQFAFSLFFIITSLLIGKQFDHIMTYEYGFNTENVWNIPVQGNDYRLLQQELSVVRGVTGVSACEFVPALLYTNGASIRRTEEEPSYNSETLGIDDQFVPNMGLQMISGANFQTGDAGRNKVIINESATRVLGFKDPMAAIGESILAMRGTYVISGVVKDFKFQAPIVGNGESPLVMHYSPELFSYLNVRTASEDRKEVLDLLTSRWEAVDTMHPFKVYAYTDQLRKANQMVSDLVWVIRAITMLSLIISCMGLLGMAMYSTERKAKEVGIRKVLGANLFQLMKLLGRSYLIILLIACIIAAPLSYLINIQWLESFPNRVDFGVGTIVSGIMILLFLGFMTIASQLISVSRKNPVESLRYE